MDRPERDQKGRLAQPLRLITLLLAPLLISSCASLPAAQERVRLAAERGDYVNASRLLESSRKDYGRRSNLLFMLEQAYLLHLEGRYKESVEAFEQAKRRYEDLYTTSLSGVAGGFIFTPYSTDYRGEDFERILINVFQALNYVMLGQPDDALVEAKDADSKLALLNSRYPEKQKNVYREDAFCRLIMGLLYEKSPDPQDADDACLWFRQAFDTYEKDYVSHYGTPPPSFLKEKLAGCPQPKKTAEVYVIQYKGLSPLKEEISVPVPLLNGYVTQIAFPKYYRRPSRISSSRLIASDAKGRTFSGIAECGEDIGRIATKNLDDRKVRVIAKAALTAAGKYLILKNQEGSVAKHNGSGSVDVYRLLTSLYFFASNRADLRSWQTLPEQIMISRLALEPGEYSFEFQSEGEGGLGTIQKVNLGTACLKPAEKKFFIVRSPL